jgi:DNA-binding MurR/RpiR family transcriptional regulator
MTFLERLTATAAKLTDSDQRIVRALLDHRTETMFLSGPQLAERVSVHEATATRLAQKLGYKGYPEMRAQLQREAMDHQDAANRIRRSVSKVTHGDYLADLISTELTSLENLSRCISQAEIDATADAIVAAKRVFIFAQGHAESVASFLQRRLDRFGMTTIALTGRGRDIAERLVSLRKTDVVLALAFRKRPASYVPLVAHARKVGARVILISDLLGSTMAPTADLMLAAPRGRSGSEFQTPTVPLAIVNGILLTIAGRHERQVMGALETLSGLFEGFD